MNELTQIGIIRRVSDEKQFGANGFRVKEFVIEVPADNTDYDSQFLEFQLTQDKCELIEKFNLGDEIKIYFNLRGRKWPDPKTGETKVFNSLQAWRLSSDTGQQGPPASETFTEKVYGPQQGQIPNTVPPQGNPNINDFPPPKSGQERSRDNYTEMEKEIFPKKVIRPNMEQQQHQQRQQPAQAAQAHFPENPQQAADNCIDIVDDIPFAPNHY